MLDDLREILDRLNWARLEIDVLKTDIYQKGAAAFRRSTKPHESRFSTNITIIEPTATMPVSISARTGSIINETRSCLDALASTLAIRNGRTTGGVYFPITETQEEFEDKHKGQAKIRKLLPSDQRRVATFRPYLRADDGNTGNILLWGLHRADVIRKHTRLIARQAYSSLLALGDQVIPIPMQLIQGEHGVTFGIDDPNASVVVYPMFCFDEPDVLKNREVLKTLNQFVSMVESIVKSFS